MNVKVNQSQTQKINPPKSGMEVFLTQSPSNQTKEEKKLQQTNPKPSDPPQKVNNVQNNKEKEIEQIVEQLEQKLNNNNIKVLDLSTFNEIVFKKQLQFKLMFIRAKIYVLVKDPNSGKTTVAGIKPPRWGGSSLRYLISECVSNWCVCVERATSKGKILTYKSTTEDNTDDVDIDDIFE